MHASKRLIACLAVVAVLIVAGGVYAATNVFKTSYTVQEATLDVYMMAVDSTNQRAGVADSPNFNSNGVVAKGTEYDFGIVVTSSKNVSSARIVISIGPLLDSVWDQPSIGYVLQRGGTYYQVMPNIMPDSYQYVIETIPLTANVPDVTYIWITHHASEPMTFAMWAVEV